MSPPDRGMQHTPPADRVYRSRRSRRNGRKTRPSVGHRAVRRGQSTPRTSRDRDNRRTTTSYRVAVQSRRADRTASSRVNRAVGPVAYIRRAQRLLFVAALRVIDLVTPGATRAERRPICSSERPRCGGARTGATSRPIAERLYRPASAPNLGVQIELLADPPGEPPALRELGDHAGRERERLLGLAVTLQGQCMAAEARRAGRAAPESAAGSRHRRCTPAPPPSGPRPKVR